MSRTYIYIHNYTYTHICIYIYAQEFHKPRSRFFRLWNLLRDSGLKIGVAKILAHHSFSTETRMHRILHFSSEWLSKPMPYSSIVYIYRAVKAGNRCSPLLQELWSVLVFSIWNWDDLATYTVGCVPLKSTTLRSCSLRSATCIPKSMMFFFRSATGGCGMLLTGNLFRFIHARFFGKNCSWLFVFFGNLLGI